MFWKNITTYWRERVENPELSANNLEMLCKSQAVVLKWKESSSGVQFLRIMLRPIKKKQYLIFTFI